MERSCLISTQKKKRKPFRKLGITGDCNLGNFLGTFFNSHMFNSATEFKPLLGQLHVNREEEFFNYFSLSSQNKVYLKKVLPNIFTHAMSNPLGNNQIYLNPKGIRNNSMNRNDFQNSHRVLLISNELNAIAIAP